MGILYLGIACECYMLERYFKPERERGNKIMFTWMTLSEIKECKEFSPVHLGEGVLWSWSENGSLG